MSLVLYIYTLENGQIKVEKVIIFESVLIVVVVSERRVIDGVEWIAQGARYNIETRTE